MPPQQESAIAEPSTTRESLTSSSAENSLGNMLDEKKSPSTDTVGWSSPTSVLPLLVFIDMLAVSLVVPLLFQYYRSAGVTNANQRELLSSVFSSSQIVGGIALGAMTDAGWLKRRTVLFLSFGGSAVAYAMIAFGGFHALIFSRILVGLVKQTMTITTSILTKCTNEQNRAKYMGRMESSTTAAWIIGPSIGAILFKYVGHKVPALLACGLFLFNMMLATLLLGKGIDDDENQLEKNTHTKMDQNNNRGTKSKFGNFWINLKSCFSSKALGSVIASMLLFSWVARSTSYASMGSYYEDMYNMEPHHRGYIQSYQRVLGFIVQSSLVEPLLLSVGGETRGACLGAFLLAVATFSEIQQSVSIFVVALSPAISLSNTMMNISLRSLLTRVTPEESIFSVFAALDILQNTSAVTVPFYRTFLFRLLGGNTGERAATMAGDPDPVWWAFSSGIHWTIAAVAMTLLLKPYQTGYLITKTNQKQNKRIKVL